METTISILGIIFRASINRRNGGKVSGFGDLPMPKELHSFQKPLRRVKSRIGISQN